MIAFEYTAGWGVLLTAVVALLGTAGTLGGVALTLRSARKSEGERREHERALRELDVREAVRARLHDDRVAAYRLVRLRLRSFRRAADERDRAFAGAEIKDARVPGSDVRAYKMTPEGQAAQDGVEAVSEWLAEALLALDPVASRAVRDAALALYEVVREELRAAGKLLHADDERRAVLSNEWHVALQKVHLYEMELRDAISDELGLDE